MPGYYETYLHGLQQAAPLARLAETERQNAFLQQYRTRALMGQEAQREANQRRLESAMEEQRRHHGATEETSRQGIQAMLLRLQNQMNQGSYDIKEDSEGNQWAYDKRNNRMTPVGGAPSGEGAAPGTLPTFNSPKPLPAKERGDLSEMAGDYQALVSLAKSFKPKYAGALLPAVGRLENVVGQYGPEALGLGDQANWWRMQEKLQNIPERHAAFGGSVTRTETPLWERGAINPGMRPEDIVKNLNIRAALLQRGLGRRLKSASTRYNKREVEAAGGMSIPKEIPQGMPDFEGLAGEGSRVTGIGRPPIEQLLGQ